MQKVKNYYHLLVAILANAMFFYPSRKLIVIGVTGTDGKTTTTSLIYHILNSNGFKVSMISSVGAIIGEKTYDVGFHVTNPSSLPLQRFIKKAASLGTQKEPNYLVLETTSHGLDQYRTFGVKFAIGVITNITHEHLDYHKTYEKYLQAKAKLPYSSGVAVLNAEDLSYPILLEYLQKRHYKGSIVTYGLKKGDINSLNFTFKSNLIGDFNIYNSLAAICVCKTLNLSDEQIKKGLATFSPPKGREEVIYDKDFSVMIDFAHTSNSILVLLQTLRPKVKGRIIHVFGSAGERDRQKRKVMGENSSKFADIIVLTAEDPRSEDVNRIIEDIASGIPKNSKAQVIKLPNREEAIKEAILMAKKGDMVVLTGKAHEKSMNLGHGEEPWDEFAKAYNVLKIKDPKFTPKQ